MLLGTGLLGVDDRDGCVPVLSAETLLLVRRPELAGDLLDVTGDE